MSDLGARRLAGARAVIFDLDDTLVNWRAAETQAVEELAQSFVRHDVAAEHVAHVYAQIVAENLASFHRTRTWMYVRDRLALLVERLGVAGVDAELLTRDFVARAREHLVLLPGAMEAMAAARRDGRRTALLTNGPADIQRPKVERFGLAAHVDYVGITGEMGVWKPDPAAFTHVARQLGVAPQDAVMVGDSLEFDIHPAKRLGMRTVWVDRNGRTDAHADLVVAAPSGLVGHL